MPCTNKHAVVLKTRENEFVKKKPVEFGITFPLCLKMAALITICPWFDKTEFTIKLSQVNLQNKMKKKKKRT